jgi:hypothetical protein
MLSGMPIIVLIDKNNNCKIVSDNCAPYDVTIDRNNTTSFVDLETDNLIPMEDSVLAYVIKSFPFRFAKSSKYG